MERFAFISRHVPTVSQHALAAAQDILLIPMGDFDAFTVEAEDLIDGDFDGVVVVHPAAAMRLHRTYKIGVFKNANRAPVGEKPQFEATEFHVYD